MQGPVTAADDSDSPSQAITYLEVEKNKMNPFVVTDKGGGIGYFKYKFS